MNADDLRQKGSGSSPNGTTFVDVHLGGRENSAQRDGGVLERRPYRHGRRYNRRREGREFREEDGLDGLDDGIPNRRRTEGHDFLDQRKFRLVDGKFAQERTQRVQKSIIECFHLLIDCRHPLANRGDNVEGRQGVVVECGRSSSSTDARGQQRNAREARAEDTVIDCDLHGRFDCFLCSVVAVVVVVVVVVAERNC